MSSFTKSSKCLPGLFSCLLIWGLSSSLRAQEHEGSVKEGSGGTPAENVTVHINKEPGAGKILPARGRIEGVVLTADGQPVSSASLELKGGRARGLSGEDGRFALEAPAGDYQLRIGYIGTETHMQRLTVRAGETVRLPPIRLSLKAKQLSEVVVTGQYQPESMRRSVYRVRSITRERIRQRAAIDLPELLNNELGIRFSTDQTLGETDVQMMGLSGQEVKILLDGVPLVDRGATRQSLSQIDLNTVERVEIVEGPMSVMYGTDALAGVINIITRKTLVQKGLPAVRDGSAPSAKGSGQGEALTAKAAEQAGKKSSLSVRARVQEETAGKEYDAFRKDGLHQENLQIGWQRGDWTAGASVTRNNAGGWQGDTVGRAKQWLPKDQWLGGASIGYRHGRISAGYRIDYLDETIKSLGNYFPPDYKTTDADYITHRTTHLAQLSWQLSQAWQVNASASYQDYQRRTLTTDYDLQTGRRTLSLNAGAQDTSTFRTWFGRTTVQWLADPRLSFQGGLEFRQDRSTGQRIQGKPVIDDYSLFLSSEWKPDAIISIRPGIRFSKNSIYDAPPLIPSINTRLSLSKSWDLRASYARGFRAPSLRELYFDFHDANHSINGNPDLKAEVSNSFNASLDWQAIQGEKTSLVSTLSAFYNDYYHFINLALGSNNEYYYFNTDRYKTTGFTLENKLSYKSWQAGLGFSWIGRYNKYADDSSYKQEALPSLVWSPEVVANASYLFRNLGLRANLFYKYTGRQPIYELVTVNGAETMHLARTAGFSLADITLVKTIGPSLSISGGAKNLFDVTTVNNSSEDLGGAHSTGGPILKAYGRSYFIGLSYQWNSH